MKKINGYEHYYVTEDGDVYSTRIWHGDPGPRRLRAGFNRGYLTVSLTGDHGAKSFLVHRLVAMAFIPNPESKRTVNHKNGVRTDNRIVNLEWATYSENNKHSYDELGRKSSLLGRIGAKNHRAKAVVQLSVDGDVIKEYGSVMDAERDGFAHSAISCCCNGKRETHKGYKWKFK